MTIDIGRGLLNALIYMGPLLVIAGLICMYLWDRTCQRKLEVLQIKTAGGTVTHFVDKEGDSITLSNPKTGWTGTWPISSLATIPRPYPDLAGLLPRFLQREIQLAIFIEGDVEPLLNRSAHRDNVVSPNVAKLLQEVKVALGDTDKTDLIEQTDHVLANIVTGPTRELIASPDWIGSLIKSTALKALASVSDELLEALKQIRNQLSRFAGLNSTYVYLGLGLTIVLLGCNLYFTIQGSQPVSTELIDKVDAIYNALGIK